MFSNARKTFGEIQSSAMQQFHYFRTFDKPTQIAIFAKTVGGAMTGYTYANALISSLSFTIPAALTASLITNKAAFKVQDKKFIKAARRKVYMQHIDELEKMIDGLEKEAEHLLKLAREKADKKLQAEEAKEKKGKPITEEKEWQDIVKEIEAQYKIPELVEKTKKAKYVQYIKTQYGKTNREAAQRYADKINAIEKLEAEIKATQAEIEVKVEDIPTTEQSSEIQTVSKGFSAKFSMVVDTCAGTVEAFIGASSTGYVIMSTITGLSYTESVVLAPTLIVGAVGGYFGGKISYADHQTEVQENEEFERFRNKLKELRIKQEKIEGVNNKVKQMMFNWDAKKDGNVAEEKRTAEEDVNTLHQPIAPVVDKKLDLKTTAKIVSQLVGSSVANKSSEAPVPSARVTLPPINKQMNLLASISPKQSVVVSPKSSFRPPSNN